MPKRILDEDAWVDGLKKIIENNYFPDLKKRNLQLSFLTAYFHYLDGHTEADVNFLYSSAHALALYYNMSLKEKSNSPCSERQAAFSSSSLSSFEPRSPSLSAYLSTTTSQDNSSFKELLDAINAKKQEKFAAIYRSNAEATTGMLEQAQGLPHVPSITDSSVSKDNTSLSLLPTTMDGSSSFPKIVEKPSPFNKPSGKNSLFFTPSSSQPGSSVNVKFSPSFKKENTRFISEGADCPLLEKINIEDEDVEALSNILLLQIKAEFLHSKEPILAISDKSKQPNVAKENTGIADAFSFVPETPLLVAGENAPTIFTWGTIDGTPIPLAPPTPNRSFHILPIKEREAIGRKLAHEHTSGLSTFSDIGSSRRATPSDRSLRSSQHSARAILSASPAIRRMIGASIRRLEDDKLDHSHTPLVAPKLGTLKSESLKTEWEALTPDISKCKFNPKT
ncbi:DiGeorge syndrome critical region protein 14 [Mitosporidium daphniae]